jgi:hypothetical protein
MRKNHHMVFISIIRELEQRRRKRSEAAGGGRIPRLGEKMECCRLHGIQEERRKQTQLINNRVSPFYTRRGRKVKFVKLGKD